MDADTKTELLDKTIEVHNRFKEGLYTLEQAQADIEELWYAASPFDCIKAFADITGGSSPVPLMWLYPMVYSRVIECAVGKKYVPGEPFEITRIK